MRRVNARYVIATSQKVELKGVNTKVVEKASQEGYFTKDKTKEKKGEEAFFKQGEKPEVIEDCIKGPRDHTDEAVTQPTEERNSEFKGAGSKGR